jgi:hypothetical protein
MEEYKFKDSYGFELDPSQVVKAVSNYIKDKPKSKYKVIIGTDSEGLPDKMADFVTAIVVYRVGNGGRYFWRRIRAGKFFTMRDRIINEVTISLEIAQNMLKVFKEGLDGLDWDFEIHADVGPNGATSILIREVVGMIRANDFEVRTKPDSYAASSVADKYC